MPDVSQPVLVIDDFATMTRIMKGIVAQLGFADIDTAQSGEAGLEQLKLRKYGLIICDLEMESMSGAEFASKARTQPYAVRCPIVLTTASRERAAPGRLVPRAQCGTSACCTAEPGPRLREDTGVPGLRRSIACCAAPGTRG